mgnify:CR=1 FL=1
MGKLLPQYIYRPYSRTHGTPTEKYCFYLGMGRSKHYGQISRKLDAQWYHFNLCRWLRTLENKNSYLWARRSVHPANIHRQQKENKIILKDILLGEVWLCSGQSNMEWSPNNGIHNRQEEIDNANHPHIRFFSLSKQGSKSPQEDCYAQWEQCTPEIMQKRSAIAYFFGKRLQQKLNVPIGLIVSAWGGTPAEVWTPRDTVINNKVIAEAVINKPYPGGR